MQRTLSNDQIAAFYHDIFVEDQTRHFIALTKTLSTWWPSPRSKRAVSSAKR